MLQNIRIQYNYFLSMFLILNIQQKTVRTELKQHSIIDNSATVLNE